MLSQVLTEELCSSLDEPLLDLESFWNIELRGKLPLELAEENNESSKTRIVIGKEDCKPPLVLMELWLLAATKEAPRAPRELPRLYEDWCDSAKQICLSSRTAFPCLSAIVGRLAQLGACSGMKWEECASHLA